jgi:hypothetical protein
MNAYEYILTKQTQWALNNDIELIGSKGSRGRRAYTKTLDENLFESMEPFVADCFAGGDGNEINGTSDSPAKMQAVHSSSAIGVNIFQYWQKIDLIPIIAGECGFCRKGSEVSHKIVFEDKYPIDKRFQFSPNIDVVFHNSDSSPYKRFAIECKFSEAYGSQKHGGIKPAYFEVEEIWDNIPHTHKLAKSISPDDEKFEYLHVAQLIKHILGLKNACGKSGFRLLYLWYDVLGYDGSRHRDEIGEFTQIVKLDGVKFHALSYQELISRLAIDYRQDHKKYISYITNRYL